MRHPSSITHLPPEYQVLTLRDDLLGNTFVFNGGRAFKTYDEVIRKHKGGKFGPPVDGGDLAPLRIPKMR